MNIRVLLADDHDVVRQGLRSLLEKQSDITVVGEAENGRRAVDLAAELSPDVIIMDITMPDLNGVEATRRIKASGADARIVALSMHSGRRFMAEILKAGASGYLLKECAVAELVPAIRTVLTGRPYISPKMTEALVDDYVRHVPDSASPAMGALTGREREVLQLIAEGRSTKEIAALLHVSIKTIETHRAQIMEKLRIHSVAGLTKFAVTEGITSPEP